MMLRTENRNVLWATLFVDELTRHGVTQVCIAPGSRSTPLAVAFAESPEINVTTHLDERSAAFFALGLALASGQTVALLCTSGTAAANFFPAIIEAHQSCVPLLVLTADRPAELRDSGANQTMDQLKLYGDQVRWFVDVALPEPAPSAQLLRYVRGLAGRAVFKTHGMPPGPVHLNFPFRKPLEPTRVPDDVPDHLLNTQTVLGRTKGAPLTRFHQGTVVPTVPQIEALVKQIQVSSRGVIVCGPRSPGGQFPQAVTQLARMTEYPILAEATSGVRFGSHVTGHPILVMGGYETFLAQTMDTLQPDLILRFGAMPVTKSLLSFLDTHTCPQILLSEYGQWSDATYRLSEFIWADPTLICQRTAYVLAELGHRNPDLVWAGQFRRLEQRTWQTVEVALREQFVEGGILEDVVEALPAHGALFVASSLPIRHLDQFARPRHKPVQVFANRGVSGIDGIISTGLGVTLATHQPTVIVLGDLSFYHDLTGLLALRRHNVNATIVVINNNGGGIFKRLPITKHDPPFTDLFLQPHDLEFQPAAYMFGADYHRITDRQTLQQTLSEVIGGAQPTILEVITDSTEFEQQRQAILQKVL